MDLKIIIFNTNKNIIYYLLVYKLYDFITCIDIYIIIILYIKAKTHNFNFEISS